MNPNPIVKFIVDVGVGRSVEEWLKSQEFTIVTIGSINPEMKDTEIIQLANMEDAIIIAMDKDFGELVFKEKNKHKGILLLKIRRRNERRKIGGYSKHNSRAFKKIKK